MCRKVAGAEQAAKVTLVTAYSKQDARINIIILAGFHNRSFYFGQIVHIDVTAVKMYNSKQIINSRATMNIRRRSIECRA